MFSPPGVRMGLEVQLPPAPVGDVRVQLGRRKVRVSEHLLNAAEVRAAFEEVGRERVPEQVRVDPRGVEPGALR